MMRNLNEQFVPYDDNTQPTWRVPGYKETFTRTPNEALLTRPKTLSERVGPVRIEEKLMPARVDSEHTQTQAQGQRIYLRGRVLDSDGSPVRGAILEIWQANASGRYRHAMDATNPNPLDPHFDGAFRLCTDARGEFALCTIKPGGYPVPQHPERWWRPPHMHFSVFGDGFASRLVTQMYFPGEPLNAQDRILHSVPDAQARARLIAQPMPMQAVPQTDHLGFCWDVVIRGAQQTPIEQTDTHATNHRTNSVTNGGTPQWR